MAKDVKVVKDIKTSVTSFLGYSRQQPFIKVGINIKVCRA
jgi:hypothetical protein